jgi:hypothetical protein
VEDTPATPEPASTRPTPRPARGSNLAPTSTRDKPVPRPSTVEERAAAERADRAAKREAREAESLMKRAVGGRWLRRWKWAACAVVWGLLPRVATSAWGKFK